MTIDPLVFMTLATTIVALDGVLIFLVFSYIKLLAKLRHSQKERTYLKRHVRQKARKLLDDATDKAIVIMNEAQVQAQRTLSDAATFESTSQNELGAKLKEVTSELLKTYQTTLQQLKGDNINILKNISKDLESDALHEVADFKEVLERETISSQKIVEQKLEQAYAQVEDEVQKYRTDKLKKLDEAIYQMLHQVSEEVIGKALNLSEHEELVLRALKEAKVDFDKRT